MAVQSLSLFDALGATSGQQTAQMFTETAIPDIVKFKQQRKKRALITLAMLGEYLALTEATGMPAPNAIIAGIPIYNMTKIGHAVSDELMKYRSTGGVFLAHQKGGKHTLRMTLKLFGSYRYLVLKLFQTLQQLGVEEALNIMQNLNRGPNITLTSQNYPIPIDIVSPDTGSELMDYSRYGQMSDQEYSYHRTFPVITDTKIYMDMYLETLTYSTDVKYGTSAGGNIIEINLLFRQYLAPTHYQTNVIEVKSEEKEVEKVKFYRTYTTAKEAKLQRKYENILNVGLISAKELIALGKAAASNSLEVKREIFGLTSLVSGYLAHLIMGKVM